ncbi:MAG TPA: hypothetical protein VJP79_09810 [Nitrososphaera sp.]|nr:hypothetical protein [Nitrososphaera sp.]
MVLSMVSTAFCVAFAALYRIIDDRVVYNFMIFLRGFELAIFAAAALVFLLMAVVIMLRKAKRLPGAYEVKIFDLDGNQVKVDGLRNFFSTYDAAESYARSYSVTYCSQYRFRVVGVEDGRGAIGSQNPLDISG